MKNQFGHNLLRGLYQIKPFVFLYAQNIGEVSSIIFSSKLNEEFLNFIPKGGKILEIGSGPGLQAMKIIQYRHDVEIIASDLSSEMIDYAKKKYQELILKGEYIKEVQSNLSFVQADVMGLSQFDAETFDGIYSLGAIKHFPNQIYALNECIRILKPGGKMFFAEFLAEASLPETINLVNHLKVPVFMKPIIARFLHNKHKKMVPGRADIEKWKNDLHSKGIILSGYLQGYPFFILKFEKFLKTKN